MFDNEFVQVLHRAGLRTVGWNGAKFNVELCHCLLEGIGPPITCIVAKKESGSRVAGEYLPLYEVEEVFRCWSLVNRDRYAEVGK